jgi:hypothetical protein
MQGSQLEISVVAKEERQKGKKKTTVDVLTDIGKLLISVELLHLFFFFLFFLSCIISPPSPGAANARPHAEAGLQSRNPQERA